MATERISWTSGAPTTEFSMYADRVGQSKIGVYTTVRIYIRAYNRGSTGSYFSGSGRHNAWISGYGDQNVEKTGNPFLPSGVASDAQRWSITRDVNVKHNADGTRGAVTLNMQVQYGSNDISKSVSFNDFPDIDVADVPPAPTAKPLFNVTQHSVDFDMDNNGNGGATLDNGRVWRAIDQPYADAAIGRVYNTEGFVTRVDGLPRFRMIYVWGQFHNRVGWGDWSNRVEARTLADNPSPPTAFDPDTITESYVHFTFRGNDDGCDAGWAEWQVGYGNDPNGPQYYMNPGGGDVNIGGLGRNGLWFFWVRGRSNANLWSGWSNRVQAQTLANFPGGTRPRYIDSVTQLGFHYVFDGPADDGGAGILEYQVAYGADPNQAQYYIGSNGDSYITGLNPATTYYVWSRARNQRGWGDWGPRWDVRTSSGGRRKLAGVWREVLPMVRRDGVWKVAQPYVKKDGVWKRTA